AGGPGGRAAGLVNAWPILGNVQNGLAWDASGLPAGPAGKCIRTATGAHGIMAGSRNPEAAWELLKWLSSTESQARLAKLGAIIPARRTAATSPEMMEGLPPNRRAFIDTIAFGRADNIPHEVNDAMNESLAPVWTGAKPAAVALQEVQPIIGAILADLNQEESPTGQGKYTKAKQEMGGQRPTTSSRSLHTIRHMQPNTYCHMPQWP